VDVGRQMPDPIHRRGPSVRLSPMLTPLCTRTASASASARLPRIPATPRDPLAGVLRAGRAPGSRHRDRGRAHAGRWLLRGRAGRTLDPRHNGFHVAAAHGDAVRARMDRRRADASRRAASLRRGDREQRHAWQHRLRRLHALGAGCARARRGRDDRRLLVSWRIRDPRSPRVLGLSGDPRQLGLYFGDVALL
jgi:hypothetical protein